MKPLIEYIKELANIVNEIQSEQLENAINTEYLVCMADMGL